MKDLVKLGIFLLGGNNMKNTSYLSSSRNVVVHVEDLGYNCTLMVLPYMKLFLRAL